MSLMRKTRRKIETILAWVLAFGILGLMIAGIFYLAGGT